MNQIGIEATIELILRGPILVHSSEIGPWGVDAVAMCDPAGRLILPGDAVQGKIREAFDEMNDGMNHDPFGRSRCKDMETYVDKTDENKREDTYIKNLDARFMPYPLFFSDFLSIDNWPGPGQQTISKTSMDVDTGAAKAGSLRTYDCPVLPGQLARFIGNVRFFCCDENKGQQMLEEIRKALRWIISFGSQKSVGFGRNVDSEGQPDIRIVEWTATQFSKLMESKQRHIKASNVLVDFSFLDPLCLPAGVVNGNIYESRDEIPGEALRGALAELLKQIGGLGPNCEDLAQVSEVNPGHPFLNLCKCFDRIRITTARPTRAGTAGPVQVIPRSLAIADDRLFDFARVDQKRAERLFNQHAAAFCHDWKSKDWKTVNDYFKTVFPRQELRVRTAVESNNRRAKTHSLFAYRMIRPEGIVWRGTVSIDGRNRNGHPATDDELNAALNECLAVLDSGWLNVGKTRARGRGQFVAADHRPDKIRSVRQPRLPMFIIMLRGPALMIDPRKCLENNGAMKSLKKINQLYKNYWKKISEESLEELPKRRFKQDALVGGFQARKYRYSYGTSQALDFTKQSIDSRKSAQKDLPYNPTLIIEAGSVFVLQVTDPGRLDDAKNKVIEWLNHGLPLPEWAAEAYGDTHHTNIFIPQNGFGEIDVNLPCHNSSFESPLTTVGA
ncbi:MAG: hypothetical protein JW829_08375 [Pirellulales bacterium]|nr:hypothetical protein [Pirellulales bacterium]